MQQGDCAECIKNFEEGTVQLAKGDFVIFHFQFRVGNDNTIAKDWQALNALESFVLPWSPWDCVTPVEVITAVMPTIHTPPVANSVPSHGRLLCVPFDHAAVSTYYADFTDHSEERYLDSHFGSAHRDVVHSVNESMLMMGDRLLARIIEDGNVGVLLSRLRECGRPDIVDKIMQ